MSGGPGKHGKARKDGQGEIELAVLCRKLWRELCRAGFRQEAEISNALCPLRVLRVLGALRGGRVQARGAWSHRGHREHREATRQSFRQSFRQRDIQTPEGPPEFPGCIRGEASL